MTELNGLWRLPVDIAAVQGAQVADAGSLLAWQVDLDEPTLDVTVNLLDEDERQRAARFSRPHLSVRYRRAHGALRWLLGRHCGVDGAALRFVVNAHGKPALQPVRDGCPPPAFNLSHSDRYALIAICDQRAVGVDIESLRAIEDLAQWGPSQLSATEREQWQALAPAQRTEGFLRLWTRKEAVLKAHGLGLTVIDAARIDVGFEHDDAPLIIDGRWPISWLGSLPCSGTVVASLALAGHGGG